MRVLAIEREGATRRIVTYLSDAEIQRLGGVPPEAVAGLLDDGGELQVNAVFREFLHAVIAEAAPRDPDMQRAAAACGDGRVVYIDSRVPETVQPVPEEDIIGWFRVRQGRIEPGAYLPNPHHRIAGAYGFTAVTGGLREELVAALLARDQG